MLCLECGFAFLLRRPILLDSQRKGEGVFPANREDRQRECLWVVPSALREANRESAYHIADFGTSEGSSLMAV